MVVRRTLVAGLSARYPPGFIAGEFYCRGEEWLVCWLKFAAVPFWNSDATLEHEDSYPHRVSWLPVPGSRPFACAGGLRELTRVPDGDSGRGWNCRRGPLCTLALAIIQ